MAALSLVFDLLGRDVSASRAFRDVGDAADRAGRSGENFGGLLSKGLKLASGALLGAGLVEGFKALFDAASESAKIGRLTENVIRSTGGAAGISAKQVGDLANAISKKTGVDDEAIQSGANLLLTFTNVRNEVGRGNDIFNQATGIITDMSVALGQDTSSSAIQLGKALNDPIKGVTALQRVGVSFTAAQKDQIKTLVESGQTMEAQKLILAELTKEFGGAAEAAGTPFDKLKVNLGNLAETLGGYVIPIVNDFATFLSEDVLPAAKDVADAVGGVLGPALHGVGEALKFVFDVGKVAVDLFTALPGPVQAGAIAFGLLLLLRGPLAAFFTELQVKAVLAADAMLGATLSTTGLKTAASGLAAAFSPAMIAITSAVILIPPLIDLFKKMTGNSDSAAASQRTLAEALKGTNGILDENARKAAQASLVHEGLVNVLDRAGVSGKDAIDGLLGNADAQDRVNKALQDYATRLLETRGPNDTQIVQVGDARDKYLQLAEASGLSRDEAAFFADAMTGAGNAAAGAAAGGVDAVTQGLQDTAAAADAARSQTDLFKTALDVLTGAAVDITAVEAAFWAELDKAKTVLEGTTGAVLDDQGALNLHSEAGRAARDTLVGLASDANAWISTMRTQGATTEQLTAQDQMMRDNFYNTALQISGNATAAQALTDKYYGIPTERRTLVTADTGPAQKIIDNFTATLKAQGFFSAVVGLTQSPGLAFGGEVPGRSPHDRADNVPIWATAGEFMQSRPAVRKYGKTFMEAVNEGRFPAELARGYADGGFIPNTPDFSLRVDLTQAWKDKVKKALEPGTGYVGALNWARAQSGKPYIWGGVGPTGFDCSGFMSSITRVIRGQSPNVRVGSTANFPWKGFAPGFGQFMIGSTPNAGGGIGHMAGTLLGVNVESTGDHVRVGGDARGASNGLFTTRAHLAMMSGGVIGEPVTGVGHYSGRSYSFAERGPETVYPGTPSGGPVQFTGNLYLDSGEFLGVVRGEAVQVAEGVVVDAMTGAWQRGVHNG